tara:strand:- start:1145 stop:1387 length:243 start_codon:yes stop_codon:yes gene_type:complete
MAEIDPLFTVYNYLPIESIIQINGGNSEQGLLPHSRDDENKKNKENLILLHDELLNQSFSSHHILSFDQVKLAHANGKLN